MWPISRPLCFPSLPFNSSSPYLPLYSEPVVNVGWIIRCTLKYMKSPQRWPLIKGGKWDGERLWWNLNRLEMSMDKMSWKMYSLSEIHPSPHLCPSPFPPASLLVTCTLPPQQITIFTRDPFHFPESMYTRRDRIVFRQSENIQSECKWSLNECEIGMQMICADDFGPIHQKVGMQCFSGW